MKDCPLLQATHINMKVLLSWHAVRHVGGKPKSWLIVPASSIYSIKKTIFDLSLAFYMEIIACGPANEKSCLVYYFYSQHSPSHFLFPE